MSVANKWESWVHISPSGHDKFKLFWHIFLNVQQQFFPCAKTPYARVTRDHVWLVDSFDHCRNPSGVRDWLSLELWTALTQFLFKYPCSISLTPSRPVLKTVGLPENRFSPFRGVGGEEELKWLTQGIDHDMGKIV